MYRLNICQSGKMELDSLVTLLIQLWELFFDECGSSGNVTYVRLQCDSDNQSLKL